MSANSAIFNPTESTSAATGDGFSVPRLTTTGRLAIVFGAGDKGMMVYDTTLNNLFIWNGSAWESVPASGDSTNTQVIFNDNGILAGDAGLTYDKATDSLTVLGNLGVGLVPISGNGKFQVQGGIAYDSQFDIIAQFSDVTTSAAKGVLLGYNNTTNNGIIAAAYGGGTEGLTFWTHNGSSWGQRMELTATGNVGIGVTPAGTGGCLQLKSGITFPATQVASSDANTLDDYEEGTFVANITGGTTNPTTPVTAIARYTKIGRTVTVNISFSDVDTTGASGTFNITGLPFVNASGYSAQGSVISYIALTFTGSIAANIGSNESFITIFGNISNAVWSVATHNAGASRFLSTTITYTVA